MPQKCILATFSKVGQLLLKMILLNLRASSRSLSPDAAGLTHFCTLMLVGP